MLAGIRIMGFSLPIVIGVFITVDWRIFTVRFIANFSVRCFRVSVSWSVTGQVPMSRSLRTAMKPPEV